MNDLVLVTGATGFIGSQLVARLVAEGRRVRCLHRKHSNLQALSALPVETMQVDLHDAHQLAAAVADVSTVYHVAGLIAGSRPALWQANVESTRNLLEACVNKDTPSTFVHVSSLAAAGPSTRNRPRHATDPCQPVSEYGRSKLAGEKIALSYADRLPITIVRPAAVFGPRDPGFAQLFGMIRSVRCNFLLGFHDPPIGMVHVDDLNQILLRAETHGTRLQAGVGPMEAHGVESGVYFASHPSALSFRELGRRVRSLLGRPNAWTVPVPVTAVCPFAIASEWISNLKQQKSLFNMDKMREGMQEAWTCNVDRSMKDLHWKPRRSLEEGFRETIQWYFDNGWLR